MGTQLVPKRWILIFFDGRGDRSHTVLDNTHLNAALTPHLDFLTQRGANGLFMRINMGWLCPVKMLTLPYSTMKKSFREGGFLNTLT